MSVTLPTADQVQQLDVQLAKFGGVDLKSSTQLVTYVGMLASALGTTTVGRWASIPANARLVSALVFGLICVAHIVGRYYHHSTVEMANAQLKVALVRQAATTNTPVVVTSAPDLATAPPADPVSTFAVGSTTAPTVAQGDWTAPATSTL